MVSRVRLRLRFSPGVENEDIPEMRRQSRFALQAFESAVALVKSRRDSASAKRGVLAGMYSTRFPTRPEDKVEAGRIIYALEGSQIILWAAYHDHDEAYRRARRRVRAAQDR